MRSATLLLLFVTGARASYGSMMDSWLDYDLRTAIGLVSMGCPLEKQPGQH